MNVLIVDDHPLFREGVGLLLVQTDASIQPHYASTIGEALTFILARSDIDLILLDLGLPDGGGVTGLQRVRRACETVPVVILSAANDPRLILDCLDQGAMGFLTKSSPTTVFRAALQLIALGNVYVPPEALSAISSGIQSSTSCTEATPMFSSREAAVLNALLEGQPNKVIARRLGITEQTVKFHVSNILKSLKVQNRTQAVIAAARMGLRIPLRRSLRAPDEITTDHYTPRPLTRT